MIKRATYFIIAVLIFAGLLWLLSQPPKTAAPDNQNGQITPSANQDTYKDYPVYDNPDLVFYWGNGCPHCQNVETWLSENNSETKLKINYREVYYNQANQKELTTIVQQNCQELMEEGGIGVPLGFDPVNKKCIQGDTPIIDFLSAKLKN